MPYYLFSISLKKKRKEKKVWNVGSWFFFFFFKFYRASPYYSFEFLEDKKNPKSWSLDIFASWTQINPILVK